jgi:DNA-binding MarR family transcriptional regulator
MVNQVVHTVGHEYQIVNQVVYHPRNHEDALMSSARYGFEIVFLLGGTFRTVIDDLHTELATRGHGEARPIHGFALQAIGVDGVTISELGRRLGVSKQAAAKTANSLERLGYVSRAGDPGDARSSLLQRTPAAVELLAFSAEFFERQVRAWTNGVGEERFATMVEVLEAIGGDTRMGDFPGWLNT